MIEKAVYTFWDDKSSKVNLGFNNSYEMAMCVALSVELTLLQFKEVELVTNSYGKELLVDRYKIPFTSVRVELDHFDGVLDPDLWAYAKIYSYSLQNKPFIHIDNDVFLFDHISKELLAKDLIFQNKESVSQHDSYLEHCESLKSCGSINLMMLTDPKSIGFACNCGIIGINELSIVQKWKEIVDEYLFSKRNKKYWDSITDKHSKNHVLEQFFISVLVKKRNLDIGFLLDSDDIFEVLKQAETTFKMVHLWGSTKRQSNYINRIKRRLIEGYPKYNEVFFSESHEKTFSEIYEDERWGKGLGSGGGSVPSVVQEYSAFLQQTLNDKALCIKSVIDLGCGDWQFSRFIDWKNKTYLGIDCVPNVVSTIKNKYETKNVKFVLQDFSNNEVEQCDLMILKDVLIHWPNQNIVEFLAKKHKAKYFLITVDLDKTGNNGDIHLGEWHALDLEKEPFNLKQIINKFYWDQGKKITYLCLNKFEE